MKKIQVTLTANVIIYTNDDVSMNHITDIIQGRIDQTDRIINWPDIINNIECTGLTILEE